MLQIDLDSKIVGNKVDAKIFAVDQSLAITGSPLNTFTMALGERYIIFEFDGEIRVDKKKFFPFNDWRTSGGIDVNPHKGFVKGSSCKFCPYAC